MPEARLSVAARSGERPAVNDDVAVGVVGATVDID